MPSAVAVGVSGLLPLVDEVAVLLFLRPPVMILSTGDIPVTIGRWLGVVAEDLAIGGDTKKGLTNLIIKFCNIGGNRHCLMFPTSVLYTAPEIIPHTAGVIVSKDCDKANYENIKV